MAFRFSHALPHMHICLLCCAATTPNRSARSCLFAARTEQRLRTPRTSQASTGTAPGQERPPAAPHRLCDHHTAGGPAGQAGRRGPQGHGSDAASLSLQLLSPLHIPVVRNVGLGTDCGSTAAIDASASEQNALGML